MKILEQRLRLTLLHENLLSRLVDKFLDAYRNSKITDYEKWLAADPEYQALCDRIEQESKKFKDMVAAARKNEKDHAKIEREKQRDEKTTNVHALAMNIARKELNKTLGFYGLK